MNKLVIIIANRDIEKKVSKALLENKFRFTRVGSTGGYLRKKNFTLFVGINTEKVDKLIEIVKKVASEKGSFIGSDSGSNLSTEAGMPNLPLGAAPIKVGGATIFVVPVEQALNI